MGRFKVEPMGELLETNGRDGLVERIVPAAIDRGQPREVGGVVGGARRTRGPVGKGDRRAVRPHVGAGRGMVAQANPSEAHRAIEGQHGRAKEIVVGL